MTEFFTWKYIIFYSEKVYILSKSCLLICAIHTFVLTISCLPKPTPHPCPLCFMSQETNLHKLKRNGPMASHWGLPMDETWGRHRAGRASGSGIHSSCSYPVKLPQAACVPIPEVITPAQHSFLKDSISKFSDHYSSEMVRTPHCH